MDINKLEKLLDIKYEVNRVCGLCIYAKLNPNTDWGTCAYHGYIHSKHNDGDRQLSINRYGSCSEFKANQEEMLKLDRFTEFMR
jgi:hypothetical protein